MKGKRKKWAALVLAAVLSVGMADMAAPMQAEAAQQAQPVVMTTTQRCSIWNAPATAEENRIKYVDAGYQVTVYPEVIYSASGDGKTFYRTVKGAYVLCRCVTGGEENSSVPAVGSGTVIVSEYVPVVMPSLPEINNTARVVRWEVSPYLQSLAGETTSVKIGYDAVGNGIRQEAYNSDGSLWFFAVCEYDPAGRWEKWASRRPDGTMYDGYLRYTEYDAEGGKRVTTFNEDGSVNCCYKVNAAGEYIWDYYGNNTVANPTPTNDEVGIISRETWSAYEGKKGYVVRQYIVRSDGSSELIETIETQKGFVTKERCSEYNADGSLEAYAVRETEWDITSSSLFGLQGHETGRRTTWYRSDGTIILICCVSDGRIYIYKGDGTEMDWNDYDVYNEVYSPDGRIRYRRCGSSRGSRFGS